MLEGILNIFVRRFSRRVLKDMRAALIPKRKTFARRLLTVHRSILLHHRRLLGAMISLLILFLPFSSLAQLEGFPPFPPLESLSPEQVQKARELLQSKPAIPAAAQPEKPPAAVTRSALPEKELSPFEAYVQGKSPIAVSTDIKQFGYDLFQKAPSTFAPDDMVPVGPDYLLGPGDEVKIIIWGKVNADYSMAVDRVGQITLPLVGVLHLAGLSFSEAKAYLEREFSRYYKPSEVKMNVGVGRLRSITVFMVGKAENPGSYTISSLSTLINALLAAGGPSKTGTMRDIQVKRKGETYVHFDLYDFLLKGDKTKDVRLMPEDVIFIPAVGPLVGIAGDVRSPAIYELKGETGIRNLIDMAGGLNDIAFKGRVQIDRIIDNNHQIVFEADLEEVKEKDAPVQPGDMVKIFPVVQDKRVVRLSGAVQREGEYGAGSGMTVRDLISMAGGLKYYAYMKEAELTRVTPTPDGPKTEKIFISLEKAMGGDPKENIPLRENDYLFVRAIPEWEIYKTVNIGGEVRFPGTYTVKKGEKLSSLIERAGGFTDKAYLKGAIFTRESVKRLQQAQLDEAIDRLQRQILSRSATTAQTALSPEDALQQQAALERRNILLEKMRSAKAMGRISIHLDVAGGLRGSPFDLLLEEGDTLAIPERPQHVQVIGSVYNQTAFIYDSKATVTDYLKNAGGMTEEAEKGQTYVLKVDGSAISQEESGGFFGGGLMSARLDPGDTIVIPEKIERISWLKEIKDITQILFQIAATTGIIIKVF